MSVEISNAINAADTEAQYDEKAKRLLSNKIILAHILVKAVDEFQGMDPRDDVPYIEGDPLISVVPVEPGLTNAAAMSSAGGQKAGQRIIVFSIWVCMNMDENSMAYVHLSKDDLIGSYPW